MTVGKGMMPVIKIGTIPLDAVIIKPGGTELGLETFAEAAFGLGIDVDAFGDVGKFMNELFSVKLWLRRFAAVV